MAVQGKNILVIAAHPDDEIIGCAGTLARHVAMGDTVHVLILAEGATSREHKRDILAQQDDIAALQKAQNDAAAILGCCMPLFAKFPDNRMDGIELLEVVKTIEKVAREIRPEIVYTHHAGDLNVDHKICHQAVMTAFRPIPGEICSAIYAFETVSSTEWGGGNVNTHFMPSRFVDISEFLHKKEEALACYESEMRPFPHARSVKNITNIALYRGASVGIKAAEAFVVVREVVR